MQQIADWLQKLGVEQCAQRYPEHCINLERATPTLLPSNKRTPVSITCKIWYSISQTVSDLGNIHDRSIRAFAVKPRAFGAPLSGFGA
jgi:hypothetical protein